MSNMDDVFGEILQDVIAREVKDVLREEFKEYKEFFEKYDIVL